MSVSAEVMSGRRAAAAAFSKLFRRTARSSGNASRKPNVRGGPVNELTRSRAQAARLPWAPRNSLATGAHKATDAYQEEVNRLRNTGEWQQLGFLERYDNIHGVRDWILSRKWAEKAFKHGFMQGYPQGSGGSSFVIENGAIYGPGRIGKRGDTMLWQPRTYAVYPEYHVSMVYKMTGNPGLNNGGFGFHVTTDNKKAKPVMRYFFDRKGDLIETKRNRQIVADMTKNQLPPKVANIAKAMKALLANHARFEMQVAHLS